jgi:diguanylate cyclase (GGDEF)-like protein
MFGDVVFDEGEEFLRFRYRFTCAILVFIVVITGLFVVSVNVGVTDFDITFYRLQSIFLAVSLLMFIVLHGHKERLIPVAATTAVLATLLYCAAFLLNTSDELRVIWFLLNLPAIYLILGSRVGIVTTVTSMGFILLANPFLDQPYSVNALVTVELGMVYVSALFHAFSTKSISFHHAMVEANRRLGEMATRDPLTNLLNARTYYSICDRMIQASVRSGSPFCVLFIDLDHFKRINDTYGHEMGDEVLKTAATCIERTVRHSDVVGRIGGEEFSVLLPDTDRTGARRLAEKIRTEIEALTFVFAEQKVAITASIGLAASRPDHGRIVDIQREADQAMYDAKRAGRNRVSEL